MIAKELLDILACPACPSRPPVRLAGDGQALICDACGRHYPIRDDIPVMLVDEAVVVPPAAPASPTPKPATA